MEAINVPRPLEGRTALVTGASRNIGRACAIEFARQGANVVIGCHAAASDALTVAQECRRFGTRADVAECDVSDSAAVQEMVRMAERSIGSIDISVACAAIRPKRSFLEMAFEEWDRVIATNLNSAFYLAKAVVPGMIERRWGRVIHMSGVDGWVGWENRAHNVTAKAGLHGLTKALAKELAAFGVTVNTVSPGAMNTTHTKDDLPDWNAVQRALKVPMRRLGEPQEVAQWCAFLATDAGAFVTGQVIHINGGEFLF